MLRRLCCVGVLTLIASTRLKALYFAYCRIFWIWQKNITSLTSHYSAYVYTKFVRFPVWTLQYSHHLRTYASKEYTHHRIIYIKTQSQRDALAHIHIHIHTHGRKKFPNLFFLVFHTLNGDNRYHISIVYAIDKKRCVEARVHQYKCVCRRIYEL